MRLMYIDYINIKRIKYLSELYYIKLVNKNTSFIDILEDPQFIEFLFKKVFHILLEIKYETTKGHQLDCILTAVFNIVCKYSIDCFFIENDIECPDYSKLEFDILDDISWKI